MPALTLFAAALRGFAVAFLVSVAGGFPAGGAPELERGFRNPPRSARPQAWWHWMNGMVTRKGIALDLEAMKEVGLGGAEMFHVTDGIPHGPVGYMSPEWRRLVHFALEKAHSLGLEMCIHDCAGWSSSGGPWISPEYSMQVLTWSETRVDNPGRPPRIRLPRPPAKLGYYRDIAVLAFPTPPADRVSMRARRPKITSGSAGFEPAKITDGNPRTWSSPGSGAAKKPAYIQLTFAQAFPATGLTLVPGPGPNRHSGILEAAGDGRTFHRVCRFSMPGIPGRSRTLHLEFPPVTARVFRLVFTRPDRDFPDIRVAEFALEAAFRLQDWRGKAGFVRHDCPPPDPRTAPPGAVIRRREIRNLTERMSPDGTLDWKAPPGHWTILRIGCTTTGKTNHPAPPEGRGLECDKLSRAAAEKHWSGMMAKVIADAGPLAGSTLHDVLIDSYEVHAQNWTPGFLEIFRARRGYDLLPFLPVMAGGHVVDSVQASERVLWDLRRTLADLFTENYYGAFADLAHKNGMIFSTEPYGDGNFDNLEAGGVADIPMAEFWVGHGSSIANAKQAASIAHTYGRSTVGAEAFTAGPSQGGWRNHPYTLKRLGDLMFCAGINRFIFHEYAQQPWTNVLPGMTMGPHGFHFNRCITWWKQAPAWITYLSRCQYLLRQGRFVADICYFAGEDEPTGFPSRGGLRPSPPAGYDYDGCDTIVLTRRMQVKNGWIVLPSGMRYRLLVLPDRIAMTPRVLRKVRDLVQAGAVVVGPRPVRSPSYTGFPDCDREIRALAREVWGNCDGKKITSHAFGKGRVFSGVSLDAVFKILRVPPDIETASLQGGSPNIAWIHRHLPDREIYFLSNQVERFQAVRIRFRVAAGVPELWHPDTGRIEPAPLWQRRAGRTLVTLDFDPWGSVFVVFRTTISGPDHAVACLREHAPAILPAAPPRRKFEIVHAEYGVFHRGLPNLVDVTRVLARRVQNGRLVVRADNSLAGDPAHNIVKQMRVEYLLDGKPGVALVDENQVLRIPQGPARGRHNLVIRRALYGIIPKRIERLRGKLSVDVTRILQQRIRDGRLSVLAGNRLAGDPAPGIVKQLRVDYRLDGKPGTVTVGENQLLTLPPESLDLHPMARLFTDRQGKTVLHVWEPGRYTIHTAAGRTIRVAVTPAQLAGARRLAGPWTVAFPPGWGAPNSVVFHKLVPWNRRPEPGIRYFSGTARYTCTLQVDQNMLTPGRRWILDLGGVGNIAELRVNNQSFGILWKPPFRADITRALHPGENRIEIADTNNWPNRLIGDARLPEVPGCHWRGPALASWPRWILRGGATPRIPRTQRHTWTTWRHYGVGSPLFDSGLLGPVRLIPVAIRPVSVR